MKIISWNINGIRSIIGQNPSKKFDTVSTDNKLHKYIADENPDIICLQETKADVDQIDENLRTPPGYFANYHSCERKKGYSGVVTYSKIEPINVIKKIGIEKFDNEGRIIATDFDEFVLFNIYFPNGTSGYDRVEYKLEFYDALFDYINKLKNQGRKIIVCGDYNTAHKPIDLARPKENETTSGFLPEERVKLDEIVNYGFVDSFREYSNEPDHYTWWSHRANARARNVGWRIDYHFVTKDLLPKLTNSYHQQFVEGSDHCPIILELS